MDTQGLPVELQVEKELGVTGGKTEAIKEFGVERIVSECKKVVEKGQQNGKVDIHLECHLIMKKHIGHSKMNSLKENGRFSKMHMKIKFWKKILP